MAAVSGDKFNSENLVLGGERLGTIKEEILFFQI